MQPGPPDWQGTRPDRTGGLDWHICSLVDHVFLGGGGLGIARQLLRPLDVRSLCALVTAQDALGDLRGGIGVPKRLQPPGKHFGLANFDRMSTPVNDVTRSSRQPLGRGAVASKTSHGSPTMWASAIIVQTSAERTKERQIGGFDAHSRRQ